MRPFALIFLALAACEGPAAVPPQTGTVGPEGGVVRSGDVVLEVPPGALATEVEITIRAGDRDAVVEGHARVGPTVEVSPSGTTFEVPARLTVPVELTAIPAGRTPADAHLRVAESLDGAFEALPTTVDEAAATATAEVAHLSVFVPVVAHPIGVATCRDEAACGCPALRAERPLDVSGAASLDRRIERLCWSADDTVSVLSYVLDETGGPFPERVDYRVTTLDGETLARIDEQPETEVGGDRCADATPRPAQHLSGGADEHSWSASIEEIHESGGGAPPDWYEEVVAVSGPSGGPVRFSLNRHLNAAAPFEDTESLADSFDENHGLEGAIRGDAGRFYLHNWHEQHIDAIEVVGLSGVLGDPTLDENGHAAPTARARVTLAEESSNRGYWYDPLLRFDDPDDPDADVLISFHFARAPLVSGFRVRSGLEVEELPALPLDDFYGQFGWQNGGVDAAGTLHVGSAASSYTSGVVAAIDPRRFEVVGAWEIPCIGNTPGPGFTTVPWRRGMVVRFSDAILDTEVTRAMFIRDGVVVAIGDVSFDPGRVELALLTDASAGRLIVANAETGEVTSIRVP